MSREAGMAPKWEASTGSQRLAGSLRDDSSREPSSGPSTTPPAPSLAMLICICVSPSSPPLPAMSNGKRFKKNVKRLSHEIQLTEARCSRSTKLGKNVRRLKNPIQTDSV